MQHRSSRRIVAWLGTIAVLGSLVGTAGGAAASSSRGPITKLRHVDSLTSLVTRTAPRSSGGSDIAADMDWYRSHQLQEQEFEGGEAVRRGEIAAPVARSGSSVTTTASVIGWEGSNHFTSRYSGGGNQFSGEPPDQGLCANNGRVFEIVNSVVQVYDTSGNALIDGTPFFPGTEPVGITLNEFFGQEPEFTRPAGPFGPFIFDVSCKYDGSAKRWFVLAEYLAQDHDTGAFTGRGGVFIAASDGNNPLAGWTVWDLDTTNDGLNGTPDHQCSGGFCFGDYPQLGIDGSGLYVTTNEFDLLGSGEFHGTQLYAFSKADLLAGVADPTMTSFENVTSVGVHDVAYTVQPVDSLPGDRDTRRGGTMYFGMSHSPYVDGNATAISLYRLTNTSSLATNTPSLTLREAVVGTQAYSVPGFALQKDGPTPLLQCENSFNCIGTAYPHQEGPIPLDAGNSGKVYGAWLRRGVVYLTMGTNLAGPGGASLNRTSGKWKAIDLHAGVAYVALRPSGTGPFAASRVFQGYVNLPGQNLTYPSVILNGAGNGAIGVTLVGPDYYPSGAYIRFRTSGPVGGVIVTGPGQGPNDGFTGYGDGGFDPRWGDYPGAAVAPNGTIWLANEYINQSCTFAEWSADTTCGFTRTFLANWSTHITGITP